MWRAREAGGSTGGKYGADRSVADCITNLDGEGLPVIRVCVGRHAAKLPRVSRRFAKRRFRAHPRGSHPVQREAEFNRHKSNRA